MDITKLLSQIQNHDLIKNDVPNNLTSLFNLAKDIVKDIVDNSNAIILFKTGDNYCIYHKNEIKNQFDDKDISDEALQNFNMMYPRWFTLYSFFALNQTMPMDIFTSILQYYVIIKPIQPIFNQIDNHEIDNIFNSLFKIPL